MDNRYEGSNTDTGRCEDAQQCTEQSMDIGAAWAKDEEAEEGNKRGSGEDEAPETVEGVCELAVWQHR